MEPPSLSLQKNVSDVLLAKYSSIIDALTNALKVISKKTIPVNNVMRFVKLVLVQILVILVLKDLSIILRTNSVKLGKFNVLKVVNNVLKLILVMYVTITKLNIPNKIHQYAWIPALMDTRTKTEYVRKKKRKKEVEVNCVDLINMNIELGEVLPTVF